MPAEEGEFEDGYAMEAMVSHTKSKPKVRIRRTIGKKAAAGEDAEPHLAAHKKPRDLDAESRGVIEKGLRKNNFAKQLGPDDVAAICDNMEYFTFEAGETVVRQGDDGSYFFVLQDGELEVSVNGNVVNKMGPGNAFGGIALLYNCPRTATVVTLAASAMWGVRGDVFKQTMQEVSRKRQDENLRLLEQVRILDGLSAGQKAHIGATGLLNEVVPAGNVIAREGEQVAALYVMLSGKISIVAGGTRRDGKLEGGEVKKELVPGDCFGERDVCREGIFRASLLATEASEVVSISLQTLHNIFGEEDLGARLETAFVGTVLGQVPVFNLFRAAQQEQLLNSFQVKDFTEGARITNSDGSSPCLAVVLDGHVASSDGLHTGKRGLLCMDTFFKSLVQACAYSQTGADRKRKLSIVRLGTGSGSAAPVESVSASPTFARCALLTLADLAKSLAGDGWEETSDQSAIADFIWKATVLCHSGPIFRPLSRDQFTSVAKAMTCKTVNPEEVFDADGFFIVAGGAVEIQVDGKPREVRAGGCFGQTAVLSSSRPVSVTVSSGGAKLWSIGRTDFEKIVSESNICLMRQRAVVQDSELSLKSLKHIKLVGAGAFGSVRLVEHVTSQERYALKRIRKNDGSIPEDVQRECDLLAKTNHPFMVQMITTFDTLKNVYILTELITGGQLRDLTQDKVLNKKQAQFYIGSMVLVLESLHKLNILYRDIKTENVMIDAQGYCKLVDFGLAKKLDESLRTFTLVGTMYYMAPEVIKGHGYSFEADSWSLGVLLYELLCGRLPFGEDADDDGEILNSILEDDLQFPSRYNDNAGKKLLEALLNKNAGQRLGADGSWTNVKEHKFFKSEPKLFSKLIGREMPAPFVPAEEHYSDELTLQTVTLSDAEELADEKDDAFREKIGATFRRFDRNGDGSIDRNELRTILQAIDRVFFTNEVCDQLMNEMDEDENGSVDYSEFLNFLCSGDSDAELFAQMLNL